MITLSGYAGNAYSQRFVNMDKRFDKGLGWQDYISNIQKNGNSFVTINYVQRTVVYRSKHRRTMLPQRLNTIEFKIEFKLNQGNLNFLQKITRCLTSFILRSYKAWWRHQMETFSALLAISAENSPVPGEVPTQRSVTRSFDVFFDLRLNKRWSKQSWGWWFETLSRPLWRHCNGVYTVNKWPQLMHLRAVVVLRLYVCTMQYILHDWDTYQRAKCFTVKWRRIRCEVLMHIGK